MPHLPGVPQGMTVQEFGKRMGWGSSSEAARKRMKSLTRAELEKIGLTEDLAAQWRTFYEDVVRANPSNPSAAGRVELMGRAVELLEGSK